MHSLRSATWCEEFLGFAMMWLDVSKKLSIFLFSDFDKFVLLFGITICSKDLLISCDLDSMSCL